MFITAFNLDALNNLLETANSLFSESFGASSFISSGNLKSSWHYIFADLNNIEADALNKHSLEAACTKFWSMFMKLLQLL